MKKVVVITGASTGLGLSLAKSLDKSQYQVYATMRDSSKLSSEDAQELNVKTLDVSNQDSINNSVSEILKEAGRIDVWVNNAGFGFAKTTEEASMDDVQSVMDVNFYGVVRCTKAILPHLREQGSGHIINISSVGGLVGQPFNEIYCASKFALEGYTESLASYVGPEFNLHFTLVEPGAIESKFFENVYASGRVSNPNAPSPYQPMLQTYVHHTQKRLSQTEKRTAQTPEEVAQCIRQCIESDKPPLRVRTSVWAEAFCEKKTASDPDGRQLAQAVHDFFLNPAD